MNMNTDQINLPNQHQPETRSVDAGLAHSLSEAQNSVPNRANGHARAVQDLARERAAAPFNGESVLILYGTVTGNSETLAKKLADALRPTGLTTRVRDMAHCQPNALTQANYLLVVASTYGDGEPPDDAAPFWQAVVHGNGLDLRGVRFSVLALGNTTYDHFCKCGRDFDAALERHGATRFYPRVDCDADYNRSAAAWINGVLRNLQQESFTAVSESLIRHGRFAEGLAAAERTRALDPLSVNAQIAVGTASLAAGLHDRAVEEFRQALAMGPATGAVRFHLGVTYIAMGRLSDAIRELEIATRSREDHQTRFEAILGHAYALAGRGHDARAILKELELHRAEQYVSSFGIALIHDALGEKALALAALRRAQTEHAVEFGLMTHYPPFRAIASDPGFRDVMRQLALPDERSTGGREQ